MLRLKEGATASDRGRHAWLIFVHATLEPYTDLRASLVGIPDSVRRDGFTVLEALSCPVSGPAFLTPFLLLSSFLSFLFAFIPCFFGSGQEYDQSADLRVCARKCLSAKTQECNVSGQRTAGTQNWLHCSRRAPLPLEFSFPQHAPSLRFYLSGSGALP